VGPQQRLLQHVADENHALKAEFLDDRLDVSGQGADRRVLAFGSGFAVSGLVQGDDAVVPGEGGDLVLPVLAVAAPPVQEDKGRLAFAAHLADDVRPIGGAKGLLDRFDVGLFASDHCRDEAALVKPECRRVIKPLQVCAPGYMLPEL